MSSIWPDRNRVPKKACRLLGLLLALALLPCKAQTQPATSLDEVGRFYAQIFAPQDYGADAQNWAIVQSSEGLIYVANGSGVLEYDGVSWRLIRISNGLAARSLAIDTEGRVYVGAQGEMGYLAVDSLGRMRYVSLLDHVPPDDRAFAVVWNIEETSDGLYFRTNERLFRWNGREMKVWRPTARFGSIFALSDTLYVQHRGIGLMRVVDDVLVMAPGGAFFKKDRIRGLMPWGEAAYLVVTQHRGMFRCPTRPRNEAACSPFAPGLTELLTPLQPYCTSLLPEGRLAIGTQRGGVVLLDGSGRLLRIFDETSGLRDETVWCTCVDRQGGLWLGLNNGLARVEAASALSYFDKSLGLPGNVEHVTRHQGRLYAATSLGVYQLRPAAAGAPARFEPIPGITTQCSSLLSTEEALLAGGAGGLYDVDAGRKLWRAGTGMHVTALHRSRRDPTLIYLGLYDGLVRMRLGAGRWTDAERIDGVREQVKSIVEDALGQLWLGTRTAGALRLDPAADSDQPIITRFGVADGLPAGWVHATTVAGRVTFLAGQGTGLFHRMDAETGSRRGRHGQTSDLGFVPDTTFDTLLAQGSGSIYMLTEDQQGRVWIAADEASGVASPSADDGYTFTPTALRQVPQLVAWDMVAEADGLVWVGGPNGLIRLDGKRPLDPTTSYPVWIRRITTTGDLLLYDGQSGQPGEAEPWPYQNNALRFAFAAPRYDAPERTHYRTRLDGFDDAWSAWSTETDKDYTNLGEGHYVFRAQARDVYGFISREDTFDFRILPP
ncbi:MAG: hypothetical protein GY780_04610, partial [bacterium]|nr:hypothetical protein [bacterium]